MLLLTLLCHLIPGPMIGAFSSDLAVTAVGGAYLEIISWNFVASGLIFVASSMFQAMGNTMPSLIASAARITMVSVPVLYMSGKPWFQLHHIWYVAVAAVLPAGPPPRITKRVTTCRLMAGSFAEGCDLGR